MARWPPVSAVRSATAAARAGQVASVMIAAGFSCRTASALVSAGVHADRASAVGGPIIGQRRDDVVVTFVFLSVMAASSVS
jgi:hypothetical protein